MSEKLKETKVKEETPIDSVTEEVTEVEIDKTSEEDIQNNLEDLKNIVQENLASSIGFYDELDDEVEAGDIWDTLSVNTELPKGEEIDISKLKIERVIDPRDRAETIQGAIYGDKKAFSVTLTQSGYRASVSPLSHSDSLNILESTVSVSDYRREISEIVYKKIVSTVPAEPGLRKMSFEKWYEVTSLEDLQTFFYGIFGSTYPEAVSFKAVCPVCGEEHEYKISHQNLTPNTDKGIRERVTSINQNVRGFDDMKKISLVKETGNGFSLPESKIIAILRTPSIEQVDQAVGSISQELMESSSKIPGNAMYISRLLIPKKDGSYMEERDTARIVQIQRSLSIVDMNELNRVVNKRAESSKIEYAIKGLKCSNADCGEEFGDLPIRPEDLVFTVIFGTLQ